MARALRAACAAEPSIAPRNGANRSTAKVYLIGGGIASPGAAAFMIRDGDVPGHNITVLDELGKLGGSLDGSGSPQKTVTQEILEWNVTMTTLSKSRLVRDGHRQTAPEFGLAEKHILTIDRLALEPASIVPPEFHIRA